MTKTMVRVCFAESVADIEELLIQILLFVPTRSVIKLKCVCKQWLALISDPEFQRRHTVPNPNPKISAFFCGKIRQKVFKSILLGSPAGNPFRAFQDSVPAGKNWRIIQSCNGLFLCNNNDNNRTVYVVNPTTNQFRALSSPRVRQDVDIYGFVRYALAFDPSVSPHYKVVCVTNSVPTHFLNMEREGEQHKIDIYSSETGRWKHLNIPFFQSPSDEGMHFDVKEMAMHFDGRSSESSVFCNGAVHWIRRLPRLETSRNNYIEFQRQQNDVFHYFNLAEERLELVASPLPVPSHVKNIRCIWPTLTQRYFGECGGHLYLIEIFDRNTQLEVLEMEREYSGWFAKYHVDLNPLMAALCPRQDWYEFVVLGLFREAKCDENEEEDSLTNLWLHMHGKVVSFDLKNTAIKKSGFFLFVGDNYCRGVNKYLYMDTLACV
ncbi:F-box protein At5g07610-like [Argentina anserina]|uniref:F-box protein At5g07610-like n=1 Tax=Argentina anserina TaxID=57926 RepID=UPI0021763059|nr:F-box protein At5g07610-like [Potentilla anserina]